MGVASPPASQISRETVEMVDWGEFGSGGKGCVLDTSDVLFDATTTACCQFQMLNGRGWNWEIAYQHSLPLPNRLLFACQYLERHRRQGRLFCSLPSCFYFPVNCGRWVRRTLSPTYGVHVMIFGERKAAEDFNPQTVVLSVIKAAISQDYAVFVLGWMGCGVDY